MNKQHSSEQEVFNVERKVPIAVASANGEKCMAIRDLDWKRLKRRFSQVRNPIPWLSMVYSIVFGITATAGLSIIPFGAAEELPPWVTPLYACICGCGFLVGCVFFCIDRKLRSARSSDLQDILEDMDNIEATFPSQSAEA